MKKCQMLQRKILSLSNLSLFESETIFSRKIISERKTKLLLWIYVWQLSGYLWFNGRGKWPVASLNRDPCTGDYLHLHSAGCRRSPRLMSINPLLVALSFHNNHHHWFFLIECTAGVCVCVCVFIFFHCEGFFRLQDVQDILEGMDQRSCVVNISWLRYAKFHHRRIWKCHISPPRMKAPAALLVERKRYDINDINCSMEGWYILIWDMGWPNSCRLVARGY